MTPIVIVFIAITPLVFWLLRRRAKLRGNETDKQDSSKRSKDIIEEVSISVLEVDNSLRGSPTADTEEALLGGGKEELDNSQPATYAVVVGAQSKTESAILPDQEIASLPLREINRQELSESYPAESLEQMPMANSGYVPLSTLGGSSLEYANVRAGISPPDESGQFSSGISGVLVTISTADADIHLENDDIAPDKETDQSADVEQAHQEIAEESGGEDRGKGPKRYRPPTQRQQRQATDWPPDQETNAVSPEMEGAETADPLSNDELSESIADAVQAQHQDVAETIISENDLKAPSRYRPPTQRPPRQVSTRRSDQGAKLTTPSDAPLDFRVRLTFDRFGFSIIGLLPVRPSGLDNEIDVKSETGSLRLVAQEDWYQYLEFENIGQLLRQGLEITGLSADHRHIRWHLRGRDVYVLASHPRASGFVSTNRLALGRSHVVLCVIEILQQVEEILIEAGCQGYKKLDESNGVPSGWVGLRDVLPTKAMPVLGIDPFYAIKPVPDIEIEFEGGICLRNSVWLAGYPPRIRLYGASNEPVRVLIDGQEAQVAGAGTLVADGYDLAGQHSVYCEGLSCSRSYSIVEPPDSWEKWPAYQFGQADICGPLVELQAGGSDGRVITVPMSNPLLLGAEPGQVFWCSSRRVSRWKGFVPFNVVWALPAQPLTCDKKTARILQFADSPVMLPKTQKRLPLAWCNAILDASRKGLQIADALPESTASWAEYKKVARNIRRGRR